MTRALSVVAPCPPPFPLPAAYDRAEPSVDQQRMALHALLDGVEWADLTWVDAVEGLLALGRTDVPLARLGEGHVDALRILAQAGAAPGRGRYGVWASRSAGTGLRASSVGDGTRDDAYRVEGTVRFASGAGLLDRALVPAWLDADRHVLVDLDVAGLPFDPSVWRASAMRASRTFEVAVPPTEVPTTARVGPVGFYLGRPGFAAGGVGVAACWAGGAARVVDALLAAHPRLSPAQQGRLGRMRADLVAAVATVRAAAVALDGGPEENAPLDTGPIALETRTVVADAVHRLLAEARHLTGPAGLALDDAVARTIPDLELYVLQHHTDHAHADLGDVGRLP